MFTIEDRSRLLERLLQHAEQDDTVAGVALTGSQATATADRWSDTDLILAVRGDIGGTADRWTRWLHDEFGVQHHWDLTAQPAIVRVFLLRGGLEVDVTFTPETDFGPRGPQWRTISGRTRTLEPFPAPDRNTLAGLIWHHALHAWICLRREHWWQAERWISGIRDHVITLACLRLGHPAAHAKGAHLLPPEITVPLPETLVRALTEPELHRALTAAAGLALDELERSDAALAGRLRPMLSELARPAEEVPSLGPAPRRRAVDVDQVRRLVAGQFPHWAGLPVRPVAGGGWDNWTFHLGSRMSVRLPSASEYALAVDKEHRWLPALAPQLPLPIPVPLAKGEPGAGYPYSWSVRPWLDGEPARPDRIADPVRFALDLAGFLAALQSVDPTDGPGPGLHNWYRGGTLRTYDIQARRALAALDGRVDVGRAGEVWQSALDARWDGAQRWFHGDVAPGNLLLVDGALAAVIDFGTCGVGDPACDLAIAWTLLTGAGRRAFRDRLAADEAMWARGRGWALWKTLVACAATSATEAEPLRVLGEILADQNGG